MRVEDSVRMFPLRQENHGVTLSAKRTAPLPLGGLDLRIALPEEVLSVSQKATDKHPVYPHLSATVLLFQEPVEPVNLGEIHKRLEARNLGDTLNPKVNLSLKAVHLAKELHILKVLLIHGEVPNHGENRNLGDKVLRLVVVETGVLAQAKASAVPTRCQTPKESTPVTAGTEETLTASPEA